MNLYSKIQCDYWCFFCVDLLNFPPFHLKLPSYPNKASKTDPDCNKTHIFFRVSLYVLILKLLFRWRLPTYDVRLYNVNLRKNDIRTKWSEIVLKGFQKVR